MLLNRIMIFVPNLSKARTFYEEVLGFTVVAQTQTWLSFAGAGCDFVAYKCEKSATVGDYANESRSVFVFKVPDLDASLAHLRAHNVTVLHATPGCNEDGRYAAFVDPFGIVHEIFEPRAKS